MTPFIGKSQDRSIYRERIHSCGCQGLCRDTRRGRIWEEVGTANKMGISLRQEEQKYSKIRPWQWVHKSGTV